MGYKDRINRRDFLGTGLTAFAGVRTVQSGVPRNSRFSIERTPPNSRIGIGFIGTGRIARSTNLRAFLELPDVQVVAVCDVDSWRLQNARQMVERHYGASSRSGLFRGCATYRDFRELLSRPEIDAVMISTPDHWHVPMALAAVKEGKDVCCEKPLTRSINEGRILAEAVQKYKRVFRTDSEFRSLPNFHRACQLVRNGRIGELRLIRVGVPFEPDHPEPEIGSQVTAPPELDYEMWLGPAPQAPYVEQRVHPRFGYGRPGWMRLLDYCDGMITNWGSHLIDIAQWGNDTDRTGPISVEGYGRYSSGGFWNVLEKFEITYRYENGVRLEYRMESPYIRFHGSEGWIHAGWDQPLRADPISILDAGTNDDKVSLPLRNEKVDFIEAVKTRGQTLEDAEVGHRTASVCHLGHIAIQVGSKLEWDPAEESFRNHKTANELLSRAMRPPWTY